MKLQSTTHVVMDSIVLEEPSSSIACGGSSGGSRAIDRHNPIIRDEKRLGQGRIFPSHSTTTAATTDQSHLWNQKPEVEAGGDQKRKSVAYAKDGEFLSTSDWISPASSSRYNIATSESHHVMPPSSSLAPPSPPREHLNANNGRVFKKKDHDLSSSPPPTPQPPPPSSPPSPSHPPPSSNQVVVLEVALHCRGCERKMKKHISKIEGVTSFKIEFAAKKVTVVGDVTPLAVLTSVLKVKNAKLLTPAIISSSSPPPADQTGSNSS
ncbi:protein SODIUM POTASSIUM ROOT DEFECTIVE 3-like [Bidens hawaiensis]|uniref:protein SODIUM POTASSIUM ROOT DEFECTIVE 3-like n=1 Tax=Bidens hawaiensis TaxID=980011 RepID=UPI004049859F